MLAKTVALLTAALAVLVASPSVQAGDVVITSGGYPRINATALDQPELYALLTDGGAVITDGGQPVVYEAFVDTGASGFVISNVLATGNPSGPSLGLGPADFIGEFTETGIAGTETGDVTRLFGVSVSNITPGTVGSIELTDFNDYGQFNLWTRRAAGIGEVLDLGLAGAIVDPLNIVGMPIISQRTMVMDPTTMDTLGRMSTYLLPPGDPAIPATNITFELQTADLTGQAIPPEILPSVADNPMIPGVTICHNDGAQTLSVGSNPWLFDTGSGSTFISFAKAQAVGLIGPGYSDLADFMAGYAGQSMIVGGIGPGSVTAPILQLDEIRVPAAEGFDVVWKNVDVLVVDVAGLDGVFGMNLLLPSATVDTSTLGIDGLGDLTAILQELQDLLEELFGDLSSSMPVAYDLNDTGPSLEDLLGLLELDVSPMYFEAIVLETTDPAGPTLRLQSSLVPEPLSVSLLAAGGAMLLLRRRR